VLPPPAQSSRSVRAGSTIAARRDGRYAANVAAPPSTIAALGGTVAVLLAVGALGSLLPALRAGRIEPTEALRSQ
jgi:ABC-type antimicrobial peptide transport system permease subunit